jgi:tripartite-type tricarboxylate transporter receptor subunit TctC
MKTRLATALVASVLACSASLAAAQSDFPNRPVRILVGFPPGGATDILARALAQEARVTFGQEMIIMNRAGANGSIAINEVIAAKPDGYTIGIAPTSAFTLAFHFMDIRPDLLEGIDALMMAARQRVGMVVRSDSAHKTLKDLVEFARKNPGKLPIGVSGVGSSVDVFTRTILQRARIDAIVVPFKGDADVTTALLGGQVAAGSYAAGGWAQQVQAGAMRLVASFMEDRFSVAPDVPTLEEMGYGLTGTNIQFIYGPKGMPPAVAKRLIAVFSEAARSPTYVQIAVRNELYEKNLIVGQALMDYLLKDRATNAALVDKLGMKKKKP